MSFIARPLSIPAGAVLTVAAICISSYSTGRTGWSMGLPKKSNPEDSKFSPSEEFSPLELLPPSASSP